MVILFFIYIKNCDLIFFTTSSLVKFPWSSCSGNELLLTNLTVVICKSCKTCSDWIGRNCALKFVTFHPQSSSAQKSPDLVVFYPLVIATPLASFSKWRLQGEKMKLAATYWLIYSVWMKVQNAASVFLHLEYFRPPLKNYGESEKTSNPGTFFGGNAAKLFCFLFFFFKSLAK